jgi:hypothetical protein
MEIDDLSELQSAAGPTVLDDLSDLKNGGDPPSADPMAGLIKIPLNGEVYWAVRQPAADTMLGNLGSTASAGEIAQELGRLGLDGTSMDELARVNPVLAIRVAASSMSQTEKSLRFLQEVLLPESARRWRDNMRPLPPMPEGADPDSWYPTDDELAAHRRKAITLPQCMGVYQRLMVVYSGRPTVPPSSSQNGHGGTGGGSTAGAPPEVSTP